MRAISFDVTIPGYLAGKALGGITESVLWGRLSGLGPAEVVLPPLPGDDWLRLEVVKAGICGTDIGTLTFKASPAMEPFASFPAVPGHEILARVAEAGPEVRGFAPGQRVVLDPMISCGVRGFPEEEWCDSCARGRHCTCERMGDEGILEIGGHRLRPGATIGYHADLPGGWGPTMLAHVSQVFPVDDALEDNAAVLLEPLAVGMHAVLGVRPLRAPRTLVLGSGPIALGTVWALRAVGYQGKIVAQMKRKAEGDLARRLGASRVVHPGEEARAALLETGARPYKPLVGDEVYSGGGFPLIFDCVGSGETLHQALRFAAPRGRIVMLGCAARIRDLDLTFTWARELDIKGFVGYGSESWEGGTRHTFEITHDLLLRTEAPVADMVTHIYPISQYREALSAAADRRRSGAVKVVLDPGPWRETSG
ncbi:MAG: zinc-binding dehydrogenase [Gemmatimonadota bacterium]